MNCATLTRPNSKKQLLVILTSALGLFFAGFLSTANAQQPDDLLIIVNNTAKTNQISRLEIKAIFLKQRGSFSAGGKATPINARKGSHLRKTFQTKVIGMPNVEEQQYWQQEKIKAGTNAPVELTNTVRAVFSTKAGISYCFRKDYKPGTSKIILTL